MSENEKLEQAAGQEAEVAKTPEKPAKADKAEKKDKQKSKPGFFARVKRWFREMKAELKKVQWPTGKQTVNNTVIVIVCVIIVGIAIGLFDTLAQAIISALMNLAQTLKG